MRLTYRLWATTSRKPSLRSLHIVQLFREFILTSTSRHLLTGLPSSTSADNDSIASSQAESSLRSFETSRLRDGGSCSFFARTLCVRLPKDLVTLEGFCVPMKVSHVGCWHWLELMTVMKVSLYIANLYTAIVSTSTSQNGKEHP